MCLLHVSLRNLLNNLLTGANIMFSKSLIHEHSFKLMTHIYTWFMPGMELEWLVWWTILKNQKKKTSLS